MAQSGDGITCVIPPFKKKYLWTEVIEKEKIHKITHNEKHICWVKIKHHPFEKKKYLCYIFYEIERERKPHFIFIYISICVFSPYRYTKVKRAPYIFDDHKFFFFYFLCPITMMYKHSFLYREAAKRE